jgi:glutamine synthetase
VCGALLGSPRKDIKVFCFFSSEKKAFLPWHNSCDISSGGFRMHREKLIFCGTSDFSGHVRGKAFPAADLSARAVGGVGMPPTNIMLSAFGPIHATPFGTAGELALVPDISTLVHVEFEGAPAESFCLGDLREDGRPWACCPRDSARRAVEALRHEAGLTVRAAFEQEFYVPGLQTPGSFRLESVRRSGFLGDMLLGALRAAAITPDSFVAEYAPGQFEVTVAPATGLRAADEAVITRELIRAVAFRLGHRATLAPVLAPDGVGSGTHIHVSLQGPDGAPAMFDADGPQGLSRIGEGFVAGLARHLRPICALTAPAAASYFRLRPNKWAPVAGNVAASDRGAAVRICGAQGGDFALRAKQFNVEFRVGDACASPYLAFGAVLWAGYCGIRDGLRVQDLGQPAALRGSLAEALDDLQGSEVVRGWMGDVMLDSYLMLKRAELGALQGLDEAEVCARYVEAY